MQIRKIKNGVSVFLATRKPKIWISICYFKKLHKFFRWKHPVDLNEKIRWLQFNSDTGMWPILADKYKVRNYLEGLGYGHILRVLYGVWECVDDINFDILPDKFIIRTNKASGDTILVNKLDVGYNEADIRFRLKNSLENKYGVLSVEIHYLEIPPLIIAEQYLEPREGDVSIIDYKFFCFYGFVHSLFTISNRRGDHLYDQNVYNLDWESLPNCIKPKYRNNKQLCKPIKLDEMVRIASELSRPFPFVRIDLHEHNGNIYFSEFTFVPSAGVENEFSQEYLEELGNLIEI